MRFPSVIPVLLVAASLATPAFATPISGTAHIAGGISASSSGITFLGSPSQFTVASSGLSGDFTGLGGTGGTLTNLLFGTTPVGSAVSVDTFLGLAGLPNADFTLTMIEAGIYGAVDRSGPAAPGQTCTPAGTPYNWQNLPSNQSALDFTLDGTVRNLLTGEMSDFSLVFTTQLGEPYQTALQAGPVVVDYSATLTVTPDAVVPPPVSEPTSLGLLALGGLALTRIRRRALL